MTRGTFLLSESVNGLQSARSVSGFLVGEFGIDKRMSFWFLTHIATGFLVHARGYGYPTRKAAERFALTLMAKDAAVWSDGRFRFGVLPGPKTKLFARATLCHRAAMKELYP